MLDRALRSFPTSPKTNHFDTRSEIYTEQKSVGYDSKYFNKSPREKPQSDSEVPLETEITNANIVKTKKVYSTHSFHKPLASIGNP